MMFIINAPKMFSMAWNMIKGLLDERTREKVCVCVRVGGCA